MQKSWIIYGPQGTGKTLHAPAIAKALGLARIKDGWDGRQSTFDLTDTLHLTLDLPTWARGHRRVLSIEQALSDVVLESGDVDLDTAVLYSQVVIDKARLVHNVRHVLHVRSQVTLGELCEM